MVAIYRWLYSLAIYSYLYGFVSLIFMLLLIHPIYIVPSFVQLVRFLLSLPGVEAFLSTKISQDPLEKFFGLQRQRGRSNENPTTVEFLNNTEHLRVINSFCQPSVRSNCRGKKG